MDNQFPVQELKRKKETLMAQYRGCKRQIRKAQSRGGNIRPNWFAYDLLDSFLWNVYDYKSMSQKARNKRPTRKRQRRNIDEQASVNNSADENTSESESPSNIKEQTKSTKQMINEAITILQEANKKDESDDIELYGRLLVMKLRKLSDECRDLVMLKIDNIFYETRMSQAEESVRIIHVKEEIDTDKEDCEEYLMEEEDPL